MLAGPGAFLLALVSMAATPVWLPEGSAGVDNVVLPVILAPLIWVIAFVYTCLEERLPRCAAILTSGIGVQAMILIGQIVI